MKYRVIKKNNEFVVQFSKYGDYWYNQKVDKNPKTLEEAIDIITKEIEENRPPKVMYEVEV